jgi:replicative DNA helicase
MSPGDSELVGGPADRAAEDCLLACCAMDPNWIPEAVESLTIDAFTTEVGCQIFEAMRRTMSEPDALTHELAAMGIDPNEWDRVVNSIPSPVVFPYHLRKVREAWSARRLWGECHRIAHVLETSTAGHTGVWLQATETAVQRIHDAVEVRRGSVSTTAAEAAERFMRDREDGNQPHYHTGFPNFDREYGGLPKTGLVTVIGPSGHGKSTLALNMLTHISQTVPVRMFSFEMPADQIGASILASLSGQPVRRWSSCDMMAVNEGHGRMMALDFEVVDDLLDARQIFARCWRYRAQGVGVVAIDYLQNLPILPGHDSHFTSIVESAQLFQRVAREMGLCVVMVCQGDKESVKRRREMGLGDAYGGIVVQQVTDLGLSVHRPGYAGEPDVPLWEARLHVVKNKYGPVTSGNGIPMHFSGSTATFTDDDSR